MSGFAFGRRSRKLTASCLLPLTPRQHPGPIFNRGPVGNQPVALSSIRRSAGAIRLGGPAQGREREQPGGRKGHAEIGVGSL
jgi:hypothetical protein